MQRYVCCHHRMISGLVGQDPAFEHFLDLCQRLIISWKKTTSQQRRKSLTLSHDPQCVGTCGHKIVRAPAGQGHHLRLHQLYSTGCSEPRSCADDMFAYSNISASVLVLPLHLGRRQRRLQCFVQCLELTPLHLINGRKRSPGGSIVHAVIGKDLNCLFSSVTQLFQSLFMWTNKCNTMNALRERQSGNVVTTIFKRGGSPHDSRIFTPPLSVAVPTNDKHFDFRRGRRARLTN